MNWSGRAPVKVHFTSHGDIKPCDILQLTSANTLLMLRWLPSSDSPKCCAMLSAVRAASSSLRHIRVVPYADSRACIRLWEICLSYHLDKAEASHDRESDRADKESDSIFLI
jgi:hypothetical protein